ncbi:hypothetical protein BUN12_1182 [Bacillus amyloliquefaciens]|nr:hypothetical protein [Bacillus amyloliquefaciens]ARW39234.1 hypothetical protein S101267_02147 [Bacillus amyloliquefaciens]AZV89442.1 hypothetical protein BUN12_1182 [Bacillus amyloliquefaciens]OBR26680.1 hypothetical protein SRCM101266_03091 [Bacillus amyloliquefaciens]GLW42304.1 hypothetical protein Bamy01_19490 [Bacillus amyloliquefaciens]
MDSKDDYFKTAIKSYCKRQNMSPQKSHFSNRINNEHTSITQNTCHSYPK